MWIRNRIWEIRAALRDNKKYMGIIFLWEMGNQIKKKKEKRVHDQEMGQSNKSKEGTKNRMSSLHWKRKKYSAVLNPSPLNVNYSQVMIFWYKWVKKKFRNTNTYATAESSAFSIYSKFWRQKWSFLLLCSGLFEYEDITGIPRILKGCFVPLGFYKDLHYCLFLPSKRHLKRMFAFLWKMSVEDETVFSRSCYRGSIHSEEWEWLLQELHSASQHQAAMALSHVSTCALSWFILCML